jgi:hypothetical protein
VTRSNFSRETIAPRDRKNSRCACCPAPAIHRLTWKNGWFRSDDNVERACDLHLELAKRDSKAFFALVAERKDYLDVVVCAQHEETGRPWQGTRRCLPPRYVETPATTIAEPTP